MPSIAELRAKLASAQSKKAKARLSGLQCIDILVKICRKNGVNLITSSDGMLFYLMEEVENEVESELLARGGRIAVFELNSILNFQPDYIERAVENVVNSSEKYINTHGIIISKDYLSNLMVNINDRVQECGTVGISELSSEFDLPLEMVKSHVNSSLQSVIKGNLNGNLIESNTFEERKLNNIKVAILSLTVPVKTQDLSRIVKININTVNDRVQSLIKSGEIRGIYRSGEYIPQCYLESVDRYLKNYYSRNGYVEVKLVKSFSHLDVKSVQKIFTNSVKLDSVYINRDLFQPVSILINEAIGSKSWRDLTSMLPSQLNSTDWNIVLSNVNNGAKNGVKSGFLLDNVYVSNSFCSDLVSHLVERIHQQRGQNELFDSIFAQSKLTNSLLVECVESVLSQNEDHFSEFYQLFPGELFGMVEVELKKQLLSLITKENKAVKPSVKVSTEVIVLRMMECELSLKAFERVKFDPMNVLLQFMCKELCSLLFKLLLEYHLVNNKLVENSVSVEPNNRQKYIELVVDEEVKGVFQTFANCLKCKDAVQCVSSSRELCKLMYINYNVKKDSRPFLRNKQAEFNQRLKSFTKLDSLPTCHASLNLIFLKQNYYFFFTDKLWAIQEVLSLFSALLQPSPHLSLIQQIIHFTSLNDQNTGNFYTTYYTIDVSLEEKTLELINLFKD